MIPSTQYANDGTEYSSNMSSEVTFGLLMVNLNDQRGRLDSHARECKGVHNLSVIRIGWFTDGESIPNLTKA